MNYVPLYLKTEYSLLSSSITIDSLIDYAKSHQLKALAIADNNLFGTMEFYLKCKKNNIKPLIGLEILLDNQKILLYAINNHGYKNMVKLATITTERPITKDDLTKYNQDVLAITFYKDTAIHSFIKDTYHNYYFGYQSNEEQIKEPNQVYLNECLYLEANDRILLTYLNAIKDGKFINDYNEADYHNHFETKTKNDKLINEEIVNLCNVEIGKELDLLPIYPCPNGVDNSVYLKDLCKEGLKRIFGDRVSKVYIDRLKYELDIINKMGFNNYFLVVWDYVKYAKDHGILVGPGRGSAAGSLVSYCLNITDIDPIKYHLLFERFLNPERISMPDIDIDFEDNRREEVIDYCVKKYGMKKVAGIITFGTLGSKQVIRDVGRVSRMDIKVIDQLARLLDSKLSLKDNFNRSQKLQDYIKKDSELMHLYKVATHLEGLKRHTSIHAAGIVMSNKEIDEIIPLVKHHDNFYLTGFTMDYLEDLGLLKMDFLALRNLTLITSVIRDLNADNIKVKFESIPIDDQKAYQLFEQVNTVGIFQFESSGMVNFLRKFKPSNFEDISAAVALFRPGPMNNIDTYINRKKGLEKIDYFHPNLQNILEPTYGIIVYQEQIMQIANLMAGYSLGEADVLRRAMSKKKEDIILKEKDKFIGRSVKLGYSEEVSHKIYDLILRFADYGFNRAHSVAYSMIAYKMAYLKANYPKHFMKSLLTMAIGSDTKTKEYIYECRLNNITILKPDINQSSDVYTIEEMGIRFPLTNIKNVGSSAVKSIMEERSKARFLNIYDFARRMYGKSINKKVIECLIDAGAFASFGLNRHTIHHNLDAILNYAEIAIDDKITTPELTIMVEFEKKELLTKELEVFGFYLSNHPVSEYRLRHPTTITVDKLNEYFDTCVDMVLYVDSIREIETKKKEKMVFITASDELNSIDLVLFPKVLAKISSISITDIILIKARVEKRFDKLQLIVEELGKIN